MTDIYQEIWNADQAENGVPAIRSSEDGDEIAGFVKVSEDINSSSNPELRVLTEVSIPESKRLSYDRCRALFNNYTLPERARENDTPKEREERHVFVEGIKDSQPMQVAREFIGDSIGTRLSDERWHNVLMDHWFRRFAAGKDPELSGFEHVIVGEQERGKVQGYHFWYKYYLDDGFARQVAGEHDFPGLPNDQIAFTKTHMDEGCQEVFPESVTIGFKWNAPDYERGAIRPLYKRIGGFFVGCSVEGLMAMGTVRAHIGAEAPQTAVIEGARYELRMHLSPNRSHIRTFFPVFKGAVDPVVCSGRQPEPPFRSNEDIRILSALINPIGDDVAKETVSLINAGPAPVSLGDWYLNDKIDRKTDLSDLLLQPGFPRTVELDGAGVQLSNKGGKIELWKGNTLVHQVSYSRRQARAENRTLIFG